MAMCRLPLLTCTVSMLDPEKIPLSGIPIFMLLVTWAEAIPNKTVNETKVPTSFDVLVNTGISAGKGEIGIRNTVVNRGRHERVVGTHLAREVVGDVKGSRHAVNNAVVGKHHLCIDSH